MTVSVQAPMMRPRRSPVATGVATAVHEMGQRVQRRQIADGTWSEPTPLMPPILARRHLYGMFDARGET